MSESVPDSSPGLLPGGFRAAGVACGIKDDPATLDLALFVAAGPVSAAGVFTQNRVCGAPVTVSRDRAPGERLRAVVINSGNANACTGARGVEDAKTMTAAVAGQIGCAPESVLVCSTGVIGHYLPMQLIAAGIPRVVELLEDSAGAFQQAARAGQVARPFGAQNIAPVSGCVFVFPGKSYGIPERDLGLG